MLDSSSSGSSVQTDPERITGKLPRRPTAAAEHKHELRHRRPTEILADLVHDRRGHTSVSDAKRHEDGSARGRAHQHMNQSHISKPPDSQPARTAKLRTGSSGDPSGFTEFTAGLKPRRHAVDDTTESIKQPPFVGTSASSSVNSSPSKYSQADSDSEGTVSSDEEAADLLSQADSGPPKVTLADTGAGQTKETTKEQVSRAKEVVFGVKHRAKE